MSTTSLTTIRNFPACGLSVVMQRLDWNHLTTAARIACVDFTKGKGIIEVYKKSWKVYSAQGELAAAWNGSPDKNDGDIHYLRNLRDEEDNRERIWDTEKGGFARKNPLGISLVVGAPVSDSTNICPVVVIQYRYEASEKYAWNLQKFFLKELGDLEKRGYAVTAVLKKPELSTMISRPPSRFVGDMSIESNPHLQRLAGKHVVLLPEDYVDSDRLHVATCGGIIHVSPGRLLGVTTAHGLLKGRDSTMPLRGSMYMSDLRARTLTANDVLNPSSGHVQYLGTLHHDPDQAISSCSFTTQSSDDWLIFELQDPRYAAHNQWSNGNMHVNDPLPLANVEIPNDCRKVLVGIPRRIEHQDFDACVQTIEPTLTSLFLPDRPEALVWAVDRSFGMGSSGAWVFDPLTNQILGVLFAIDEEEGCSYLLPAPTFFGNLCASVLATSSIPGIKIEHLFQGFNSVGSEVSTTGRVSESKNVSGRSTRLFQSIGTESNFTRGPTSLVSVRANSLFSTGHTTSSVTTAEDQSGTGLDPVAEGFRRVRDEDWVRLLTYVNEHNEVLAESSVPFFEAARKAKAERRANSTPGDSTKSLVKRGVLIDMLQSPHGIERLTHLVAHPESQGADDFKIEYYSTVDRVWKSISASE